MRLALFLALAIAFGATETATAQTLVAGSSPGPTLTVVDKTERTEQLMELNLHVPNAADPSDPFDNLESGNPPLWADEAIHLSLNRERQKKRMHDTAAGGQGRAGHAGCGQAEILAKPESGHTMGRRLATASMNSPAATVAAMADTGCPLTHHGRKGLRDPARCACERGTGRVDRGGLIF